MTKFNTFWHLIVFDNVTSFCYNCKLLRRVAYIFGNNVCNITHLE